MYILFMHVYYMNVYMYELQFTYFIDCCSLQNRVWDLHGLLNFNISFGGFTLSQVASLLFVLPDASKPNYYGVKSFEVY